MPVSPKIRIQLYQVLLITLFWMLCGAFLALYKCVTYDPLTGKFVFLVPQGLSLARFVLINLLGPAVGGLLGGSLLTLYLNERLRNARYGVFLVVNTVFFFVFILTLNSLVSYFFYYREQITSSSEPFAAAVGLLLLDPYALRNIITWMLIVVLTLLGLKVHEKYGPGTFLSLLLGRYHIANEVVRVILFVDISDSTGIAEKLGHIRFFDFVRDFFNDITDPILNSKGVIYQYVGDEVTVTWSLKRGLGNKADALECYFRMQEKMARRETYYWQRYGLTPSFKAALHTGKVVAGEMGVIKREIVYSGDILNTTARMLEQCHVHEEPFIISGEIVAQISEPMRKRYAFRPLGNLTLRGKLRPVTLYGVGKAGEVF